MNTAYRFAFCAIGYFLLARLGYFFSATPYGVSPVWPAAGFAFWCTLMWGRKMVFAIALATFVFMLQNQAPILTSSGVALGNALNPLLGVFLTSRIEATPRQSQKLTPSFFPNPFTSGSAVRFVWLGCLVPGLLSSLIGNLSIAGLPLFFPAETFAIHFIGWALGDTLGVFIFGLFLILWTKPPAVLKPPIRPLEILVISILCTFLAVICFSNRLLPFSIGVQIKYVILPLLVWSALRHSVRTTVSLNLWVAMTSILLFYFYPQSVPSDPPLLAQNPGPRFDLMNLQGFLAITCGTAFLLACSVDEKRRSLFREIRAKQLSLEATASRDEFLSIAAHELRTPLTPLSMHLQLLEIWLQENPQIQQSAPQFHKLISVGVPLALSQVKRLERLVDDLLDTTRLTKGDLPLALSPICLSGATENLLETRVTDFKAAKSPLSWKIEPQIWIRGDRIRMEQVLENLLSNARRYAPSSPIEITLTSTDLPPEAVLRVRDWGQGIPVEGRDHLFQKFQRFHPSTEHGGLGIGLFLCRKIIEGHNGKILYRDPLDGSKGALFEVRIPKLPPPSVTP